MKLNENKTIQKLILILIFILPFNFAYIFNFSEIRNLEFFKESLKHSLYLFDLMFLAIFFLWLKTKPKIKPRLAFISLFLIFLSLLSPIETLYSTTRIIEVLIFFSILTDFSKDKNFLKNTSLIIFISGIIQSIIAIFQFALQKSTGLKYLGESVISPQVLGVAKLEIHGEKFIRAYGTFPHPNLLGVFLFLSLLSGIFLYRNCNQPPLFQKIIEKMFKKILFNLTKSKIIVTGILIILTGILLTFSRSVWLATLLSLIFMAFYCLKEKKYVSMYVRSYVRPYVLIPLLFFLFILILFKGFIFSRLCLGDCQDQSLTLRQHYSQTAIEIIRERPLTGIGIGQFPAKLATLSPQLESWNIQPVHNLYLLIISEIGLIGFFLLAFFAKSKIRNPKPENPFFIAFLGFLFLGFFDHYFWTLPQGQFMFWLSLALSANYGKMEK